MSLKTRTIAGIIEREGGDKYTNRPEDSGGPTRFGVTETTARAYGYKGDMRDLPRGTAEAIYSALYWDAVNAGGLEGVAPAVAEEVIDTAVNLGAKTAALFLQRTLNVFNKGATLYPDLVLDGSIGAVSIAALRAYLATRSEGVFVRALNCLQGAFYIELAERRAKDEANVYGWLQGRVSLDR